MCIRDRAWEARCLELHARAREGRRNVLSPPGERHGLAKRLLQSATLAGSRALGAPVEGIEMGAPADLIAVDLTRSAAQGVPPLEAVAFASNPDWVTDVWVAGRRVVADGRHARRVEIMAAAAPYLRA